MHFFKGGKTNVCFNALDRHVERGHGDRIAFLWEGNDPGDDVRMSYREVLERVSKLVFPSLKFWSFLCLIHKDFLL